MRVHTVFFNGILSSISAVAFAQQINPAITNFVIVFNSRRENLPVGRFFFVGYLTQLGELKCQT